MKPKLLLILLALILCSISIYATNVVTLHSPADNSKHATRSPLLNFSAHGNNSGYLCNLWSYSTAWSNHHVNYMVNNNTNYTIADANFAEGTLYWKVACNGTTNIETNDFSDNRTIQIDTNKPSINVTFPEDNHYFVDITLEVNLSISELNNQSCDLYIDNVLNKSKLYSNASVLAAPNTITSLKYNTTSNGSTCEWYARCNDTFGNYQDTPKRKAYLGYIPLIAINNPVANSSSNNVRFNISVRGHSADYKCDMYTNRTSNNWTVEATTTFLNSSNTTAFVRYLTDQEVYWGVTCYETGIRFPFVKTSITNRTFYIDTTAPVVTTRNLSDYAYIRNQGTINVSVVEIHPSECYLQINGTKNDTITASSGNLSFEFNATESKDYLWNVKCNDSVANYVETSNRTISIDSGYPYTVSNISYSSNSCTSWTIQLNFSENVTVSATYGLDKTASTHSLSNLNYLKNQTLEIVFNNSYETLHYVNITACDRTPNCNVTNMTFMSPVGLCSGWSIWSVHNQMINMSEMWRQSTADLLYLWNATSQAWLYYGAAATTLAAYNLTVGDALEMYTSTNKTWFRNSSFTGKYLRNVSGGDNFFGLYDYYSFGNLSYIQFRNSSGGNFSDAGKEFTVNYYASYNNSNQQWIGFVYTWKTNNLTKLGATKNGLDTLWIYSQYNISVNMTGSAIAGSGSVYGNGTR